MALIRRFCMVRFTDVCGSDDVSESIYVRIREVVILPSLYWVLLHNVITSQTLRAFTTRTTTLMMLFTNGFLDLMALAGNVQ